MSDHRASRAFRRADRRAAKREQKQLRRHGRRRWFGQGRTRALLATGIMFGLGATGTYAFWTDQGTISSAELQSGTLDLTARESSGGSDNLTGTGPNNWNYTALNINDMLPNESISRTVVIRNSGSTPFRFNATVASSDNDLTSGSNGLQVIVFDNSTAASQTGSQSAGNRAGTCSGGSQVFSGFVSTSSSSNIFGSDVSLPNNADTRSLCVRVVLNSNAPNSLQDESTDVVLTFNATQLGAP